jgi:uncharacterized membrane protein YdjX (TVP38/TMEM64 family)
MKRFAPVRAALAVGLAAALIASTFVFYVPAYRGEFNARLGEFLEAVRNLDGWGPVIVGAAFIPACLLFIPGSPLTLFGGFAFGGTFRGLTVVTACVSLGSTLGASAAFLVGRTVARQWIETKMAGNLRFRAIDAAVGNQGFQVVLLTRLSPVFPFNLLNYAFGATRVSFRDYVLASWIGMLPGTIMYVYLGSTAGRLADVVTGTLAKSPAQQTLFYAGLGATIVVTIVITRIARRALATVAPDPMKPEH